MTYEELDDLYVELRDKDYDLAKEIQKEYKKDPNAPKRVIISKAKASLGRHEGMEAVQDATVVSPLADAFNKSEAGLRNLLDPNSPSNWTKMSSQALLDAAVAGGYTKKNADWLPEWKKQENRKNFGQFLNMLARESYDQGRRNAVREYENSKRYDPQKFLNSTLFHTYEKRAKEQALKGEGATDYDQLSGQDLSTLGLDIGANTALGAGAAGISKGLLSAGVGNAAKNYGLRSAANVAGSDLGAGALGGLASVGNRALNTDEGVMGYEWFTEPAMTASLNLLATPAALRQGVREGAHLLGIGAEKINSIGKKNALKWAQRIADEKYAEPVLASALRDLEEQAGNNLSNSVVKPETRAKIEDMYRVINDGATRTAGKETSLLDDLQQLYDASAKGRYGVEGELMFDAAEGAGPNVGRFSAALDSKIAQIENKLKNGDLTDASKGSLGRELEYYKTFRELMDNDLIDVYKYLNYADQPEMLTYKAPNLSAGPGDNVPVFELGKKASTADIELMKDYISNVVGGNNLVFDDGMMYRIELLKDKYPAFKRYVNSLSTVPGHGLSMWPSLGRNFQPLTHQNTYNPRSAYEFAEYSFLPSKDNMAAVRPNAEHILEDVVKPALVQTRLAAMDKPDNSLEALEAKMEKLRKDKPVATDAALNWKYDPRIEESKQLTAEERNLVNQYRAAKLDAAMNGR